MNSLINYKNDFGVVYTYLLSTSYNLVESLFTFSNDTGIKLIMAFLTASSPKSSSSKNLVATFSKASLGQGKNQSITVLLTKAGNCLALLLSDYPTGEKQILIWSFCLTLSMYQFQQLVLSLESTFPSDFIFPLIALIISSFYSDVYNSAISPEASKSLI